MTPHTRTVVLVSLAVAFVSVLLTLAIAGPMFYDQGFADGRYKGMMEWKDVIENYNHQPAQPVPDLVFPKGGK